MSTMMPSNPMRAQDTPPSILSNSFSMLSRKGLAMVALGLYSLGIRGSSVRGAESRSDLPGCQVAEQRLSRFGAKDEADGVSATLLVDRDARPDGGVEAPGQIDRQRQPLEQPPPPGRQLLRSDPQARAQLQRGDHPQRHRLAVKQIVSRGRLQRVADRVAEVEDGTPPGLRLVLG